MSLGEICRERKTGGYAQREREVGSGRNRKRRIETEKERNVDWER